MFSVRRTSFRQSSGAEKEKVKRRRETLVLLWKAGLVKKRKNNPAVGEQSVPGSPKRLQVAALAPDSAEVTSEGRIGQMLKWGSRIAGVLMWAGPLLLSAGA